jgi:glycosyltransferase involved in cell wall biosynthesis
MSTSLRVLQIIDTLNAGGAERMAVQIANGLANKIEFSAICCTREEGVLKQSVHKSVNYLFAKKTKVIDLRAVKLVLDFCTKHNIAVIHAHSTSYVFAVQLKLLKPTLKIIWHDHFGNSEFLKKRSSFLPSLASLFFSGIISVNTKLESWAKKKLYCKNVSCIKNFYSEERCNSENLVTLKGEEGKRIVSLANLRPQKDHCFLLNAFASIVKDFPDWTLHLLGNYLEDSDYYKSIKTIITSNNLGNNVFIYGSVTCVQDVLKQAEIGILTSRSEGLPLALIEYGMAGLPVITTNVGQCKEVVVNSGLVIENGDIKGLEEALKVFITKSDLREQIALDYHTKIKKNYSADTSLNKIYDFYITPESEV